MKKKPNDDEHQAKRKFAELRLKEIKMKYYQKWHETTFQETQGSFLTN